MERDRVIASATKQIPSGESSEPARHTVALNSLAGIRLWNISHLSLYTVRVKLLNAHHVVDEDGRVFGFREAQFTDQGFEMPFAGQAMPARVQRRDAYTLRKQLKCNIVRTSHYPRSRHFLDACDEYGLLVLEEIPGWQHIGSGLARHLSGQREPHDPQGLEPSVLSGGQAPTAR